MPTVDDERESERQAALDAFELDEFAETAYDDLVRVAADVCQTPVALIAIVDGERLWFKAKLGIEVSEVPRVGSFCAHAILAAEEVLVVEDASMDPRFAASPLVTGAPHIRFYAGAPLVTSTGHAIGAICVIDTKPRSITNEQMGELRFLAQQVVIALEERKRWRGVERSGRPG